MGSNKESGRAASVDPDKKNRGIKKLAKQLERLTNEIEAVAPLVKVALLSIEELKEEIFTLKKQVSHAKQHNRKS